MAEEVKQIEIIFENDQLIAVNKPHGLLVHRTAMARDATEFALQIVRDQIGMRVYPAHRLDRKTSGVLLFSKNETTNREIQALFREGRVLKHYHALVRGFTDDQGSIDYPLETRGKKKEAITNYHTLARYELPISMGKFQTSRYSLVEIKPESGRFHQIRKHFAHIFHPIIGDRPHGCNKQNRMWKENFGMTTMLLHARSLWIPYSDSEMIDIHASYSREFERGLNIVGPYERNMIE